SVARLLQVLLVLLTLGLAVLGFVRLRQSRVRTDHQPSTLSMKSSESGTVPTVLEQRQRAMLRDGNLWEAARAVALQFFSPFAVTGTVGSAGHIGSWQRRRIRRQVQRLWGLAKGDKPARVRPAEFRYLLAQVRDLHTAQTNGTFKIDGINSAKD